MYEQDRNTGDVYLSLSIDATCRHHLDSPWRGYETLTLKPFANPTPPIHAQMRTCVFPLWAQGNWQHLQVGYFFLISQINRVFN